MRRLIVLVALFGCPSLASRDPGYVPHPQAATPTASAPVHQECRPTTEITNLKSQVMEEIRGGFTDDEILVAASQFLMAGGTPVESRDGLAKTIVTKKFTGQTLQSTCGMNEYRTYQLRIAIVGSTMIVGVDCWRSFGYEEHMQGGTYVPRYRSDLQICGADAAPYISKGDATIPKNIIEGTAEILNLKQTSSPAARTW